MSRTRCDGCGTHSQREGFFTEFYPRVSAPPLHFCPLCQTERERRSERLGMTIAIGMVLALPIAGVLLGSGETADLARFAGWIAFSSLASITLHELGHAAAGKLAGVSVLTISLGTGPIQWRWRRGETDWEIRSLPTCGFVRTTLPTGKHPRWASVFTTVGGPAINVALLLVALSALPTDAGTLESMTAWHAIAGVNGLILLFNLIPMTVSADLRDQDPQPNDGMLIVMQLFQPRESMERWWWIAIEDEIQRLVDKGDLTLAEERASQLAAQHGDLPEIQIAVAAVQIATGQTTVAQTSLRTVLKQESLPTQTRARAEARLAEALLTEAGFIDDPSAPAYSDSAFADPALADPAVADPAGTGGVSTPSRRGLLEADRLTESASDKLPSDGHLQILRGRALLATGWIDKARDTLQVAIARDDTDTGRAKIAAWLATAARLSGDHDEQNRYEQLAASLAPHQTKSN